MAKYVLKRGSTHKIVEANNIETKLAKGTYMLKYNPNTGEWYLDQVADFKVPTKIYGDTSISQRCIDVYRSKSRNFGLLLNGLKGSGKTLLLRKLAIELDQPVIIINENFGRAGTEAIQFLSDPTLGDCTIVIDEFEKKFSSDDDAPLTLLDGPADTHHFFILTMNDMYINNNLKNRPGRVYYSITYAGLNETVVRDVIDDLLINKENAEGLLQVCDDLPNLSFDMLLSLINDMNLFNQTASEVLPYFGFIRDTQYIDVYQRVGQKLIPLETGIATNGRRAEYWVENVTVSPDPSVSKISARISLDPSKCTRLRKNAYLFKGEVASSDASAPTGKFDEDGDEIYEVPSSVTLNERGRIPLEFELHFSAVPKYDSRAY